MKRGVATYGSWLYCSKNIHCSTWARASGSFGNEARALGEIPEDGIGLGQEGAVVELQGRNPAVRIFGEEFRGTRGAGEDVELDPAEGAL